MNYQTISEIYEASDQIREKLKAMVGNLSGEQAKTLLDGEEWTIKEFIEHIALVDSGITQISGKLLNAAKENGKTSDDTLKFSADFPEKFTAGRSAKFEAPERMKPTGTKSIAESLAQMDETRRNLEELKPLFESVECANVKFPHPAFGELSAHEWLAIRVGHEMRHIKQIENLLGKIG